MLATAHMTPRPSIDAFDAECAALIGTLETLPSAAFELATNCPPWTLHELVVHIAASIRAPGPMVPAAPATLPPGTAADYYRRPERDTAEYRVGNVERTRRSAATVPPDTVVTLFIELSRQASKTFAANPPDQRMEAGGRALTIDDYLLTRVMSVAAHGVDVAITLGRPPWTTPQALEVLRPVLVDLLGQLPPASWTDQDLLEFGTGRRRFTDTDRASLGALAARFPLLS